MMKNWMMILRFHQGASMNIQCVIAFISGICLTLPADAGVAVTDAWVKATAPGQTTAAAYLQIKSDAPAQLVGASYAF
jgi:copper(I)-binding protein